jgi:hypothetical protein
MIVPVRFHYIFILNLFSNRREPAFEPIIYKCTRDELEYYFALTVQFPSLNTSFYNLLQRVEFILF